MPSQKVISRFLIAPNDFKGSLSAPLAAAALARGIRKALPRARLELAPLADGGPGFLESMHAILGGEFRRLEVPGPWGETRSALWILRQKRALIESAQAVGLPRDGRKLKPLSADSYGLGLLLLRARRFGAKEAWVGLGGSAVSDGGAGMARALGWRFLDRKGTELGPGGAALRALDKLLPPKKDPLRGMKVLGLCDVDNPLNGPRGAARIFSPQKGAGPRQVRALEMGLKCLSARWKPALARARGAGAAGGLGYGLMAFAHGSLKPGAESILKISGFEARLLRCDWVLSGEGRLDAQSLYGKLPWEIFKAATKAGKGCFLLAGSLQGGPGAWSRRGVQRVAALQKRGMAKGESMRRAAELLEKEALAFAESFKRK